MLLTVPCYPFPCFFNLLKDGTATKAEGKRFVSVTRCVPTRVAWRPRPPWGPCMTRCTCFPPRPSSCLHWVSPSLDLSAPLLPRSVVVLVDLGSSVLSTACHSEPTPGGASLRPRRWLISGFVTPEAPPPRDSSASLCAFVGLSGLTFLSSCKHTFQCQLAMQVKGW